MTAPGEVVVRAGVAGTALFTVTAALAAALFTSLWQWIAAVTALVLFAVGVFTFLWSYYNAVQRSREDQIAVSQLYLLLGPPTPPRVRRTMLGLLGAQVAVATATTFTRLEGADGKPGSSLALGFLVPMFGFGLNGLWAAYHGDFPRRDDAGRGRDDAGRGRDDAGAPGDEPAGGTVASARAAGGSEGGRARMTTMAETASETIVISAPPMRVWEIAADFERYPEWARDVKDVVVRSRDHANRPAEVEFRSSALGRSTHYTLAYDYTDAPHVLAWKMVKGDIQRSIEGAYHFRTTYDGGTEVRYDLTIELASPLPGFVKRRAEVRILNTVRELKIRAEA